MSSPIFIANWKMNGSSKSITNWIEGISETISSKKQLNCLFCPPVCYVSLAASLIKEYRLQILLGAQDIDSKIDLDLTGGVSSEMLVDLGCKFVIIGHSERRILLNEEEDILLSKLTSALDGGLKIVYCVGETERERSLGKSKEIIKKQLRIIKDLPLDSFMIAYEPVWSIGTGKVADISYIDTMHGIIKNNLEFQTGKSDLVSVAYGGSINPKNAQDILLSSNVDGLLVGGASLDHTDFSKIANSD